MPNSITCGELMAGKSRDYYLDQKVELLVSHQQDGGYEPDPQRGEIFDSPNGLAIAIDGEVVFLKNLPPNSVIRVPEDEEDD